MKNFKSFRVLEMKVKEMTQIQGGAFAAVLATVLASGAITMLIGTVGAISGLLLKYPNSNDTLSRT